VGVCIENNSIRPRKAHCMYTMKYTVTISVSQIVDTISPQLNVQVLTRVPL